MKQLYFALLLTAFHFFAGAQTINNVIKKVSAKDVKTMMDSSTGPMIINFWATWCGPCIREIPWFDSVIAAKNIPVKLLLVSLDFRSDYPKQLAAFVQKQGYKGEVFYLDDTHSEHYIPAIEPAWNGAIPASIFINHSTNYYRVFNQQLPAVKFAIELDKLVRVKAVNQLMSFQVMPGGIEPW